MQLPSALITTVDSWVVNAFGRSPVQADANFLDFIPPLRTLHGGQFDPMVEGTLAVLSDATAEITVPYACSADEVFAYVKEAPTGAKITLALKVNGAAWRTLTIAAGATAAVTRSGRPLTPLAAGAKLGMDITAVGSTFPGERLVVGVKV